jgi:hypothetical protein
MRDFLPGVLLALILAIAGCTQVDPRLCKSRSRLRRRANDWAVTAVETGCSRAFTSASEVIYRPNSATRNRYPRQIQKIGPI